MLKLHSEELLNFVKSLAKPSGFQIGSRRTKREETKNEDEIEVNYSDLGFESSDHFIEFKESFHTDYLSSTSAQILFLSRFSQIPNIKEVQEISRNKPFFDMIRSYYLAAIERITIAISILLKLNPDKIILREI